MIIFYLLSFIWFWSCVNTALDDNTAVDGPPSGGQNIQIDDEEEAQYEGGGSDDPNVLTARSFRVEAVSGLSLGDGTAAGNVVATLILPTRDGPWAAALDQLDDNGLFEIRDKEAGEETVTKEVAIGSAATLGLESYTIRVRIYHAETGASFCYKTIRFAVTNTPAPFSKAPTVYPHITAKERNKLTVSWSPPSGAKGFKVYVGTDPENRPATAAFTTTDLTVSSTDITDLEGDSTEGGLPDGTAYTVWVGAYNDSGETFSPPATRTTTAAIPEFFYNQQPNAHGQSFVSWDSFTGDGGTGKGGVDFYIVTPPNDQNKSPYMRYGPDVGGQLFGYKGDIAYHVAFNLQEAATLAPHTQYGKYGEPLNGLPAGVFIVKYDESVKKPGPNHWYQGVYYWGVGGTYMSSTIVYFSNSYGLGSTGRPNAKFYGNPETATLEQAIDRFTLENMVEFIAFVAVPWYRNYEPYSWME
jgi:hypothetical protein